MDPVEETLGSVTQLDKTSTPSVPLRSSARVSKKKLDSLNKAMSPAPVEKREIEKGDTAVDEVEVKVPIKKPAMSAEEKNAFFEAVNEYGKDFAAIQRYLASKNKNKNGQVRTKEQIRRFYYRTWGKIATQLHFPSYIPKATQELYGLINYGELRKKCKGRTKKDNYRLNELVVKGWTQIRGKNKTVVIRTPRCRILRKLCSDEAGETSDSETKVPISIRVELTPADNGTWAHVQSLAQNPRINVHLPLQCRLSSLFQYLQRRWLPRHEKYKLKIFDRYEADGEVGSPDTKDFVVLSARPDAEVHVAQVNMNHFNSHTKICLSSYEERLGRKGEALEILNKLYTELGGAKKQKCETAKADETKAEEIADVSMDDVDDGLQKNIDRSSVIESVSSGPGAEECTTEDEEAKEQKEDLTSGSEDVLARVKEGWTQENCATTTIGDVYLMDPLGLQSAPVDSTFRRPGAFTGNRRMTHGAGRMDADVFKAQMDRLTPKYSNRRGRGMSTKTLVVQRTLPIVPDHLADGSSVVTLKVLGQEVTTSADTPVPSNHAVELEPPPSPTPSISAILNESFKPFSGSGGGGDVECSSRDTAREEWLSEVTECSLSSLLNHLDTPAKSNDGMDATPPDVETNFHCMMTEASLDFTAKFAALAAEVISDN